ncbi:MAG: hydrogenase maturation peptidase HycI [Candidatus Methanofastidiosia archaeon]
MKKKKLDLPNLAKRLTDKSIILGVGNDIKEDDGVGPWIAEKLKRKFQTFNGETVPENFAGEIICLEPDIVVIIDAALMNAEPGSVGIFKKEDIENMVFSTHAMPLSVLSEYLENQTGCDVYIVGIQPKSLEFGKPMTKEIKESASNIIHILGGQNVQ